MRIKIEGSGLTVEIECADENRTVEQTAKLVEGIWMRARSKEPRLTMGYAGSSAERSANGAQRMTVGQVPE